MSRRRFAICGVCNILITVNNWWAQDDYLKVEKAMRKKRPEDRYHEDEWGRQNHQAEKQSVNAGRFMSSLLQEIIQVQEESGDRIIMPATGQSIVECVSRHSLGPAID